MSACALISLFFSCGTNMAKNENAPLTDSARLVARGEYLVTIMGCNDCHSPKRLGPKGPEVIPETMLSGYPADRPVTAYDTAMAKRGIAQFNEDMTSAAGPWGVSFSGNLTSDDTGIGNWTLDAFKRAIRQGRYKGSESGRTLLPPMPWPNFARLTDEDAAAIFAYLKSTKPVKNAVPPPLHF
ncbi:c-type cytochrome [Chitinophaga qingshengii]|uniref:C-type cytochrome n=2 Tax=Chitinophaga qingshengii TaxID=1569794 RepID=A0ABR7TPK2_9BACT|nr:c-type cytochrome [Chitinophaga qingshengii]